MYRITSIKRPPRINAPPPPPLFQNFQNKRPPRINAPPPKGGVYSKHSVIFLGKTCLYPV